MEDNKNIDDLFREELGDYTEAPPPAVWSRLEGRLGSAPARKPRPSYRWLGYFGMLSVMLLLSVSIAWRMKGNSDSENKRVASNENEVAGRISGNPAVAAKNKVNAPTGQEGTIHGGAINKSGGDDANTSQQNISISRKTNGTNESKKQPGKTIKTNNKAQSILPGTLHQLGSKSASAKNGKRSNAEQEEDDDTYNSSALAQLDKGTPAAKKQDEGDKKQKDEITAQIKKEATSKTTTGLTKNNLVTHTPKPAFNRWEAGIKAGYETGFDNDAAKKIVVSPYIQFKITPKLAVVLQPAIKAAKLSSRRIDDPKSYYKVNSDSNVAVVQTNNVYLAPGGELLGSVTQYKYTETHDSIVKSNSSGGTYAEYELPVLLKYNLGKGFSAYGGVNILYSRQTGITERTVTGKNILRSYDTSIFTPVDAQPAHPPVSSLITYKGTQYSSYNGPEYPAASGYSMRFGYMLGFSYEYKRYLLDALIQQANTSSNIQGGYNVNTPLSAPYMRFTIGYKLMK